MYIFMLNGILKPLNTGTFIFRGKYDKEISKKFYTNIKAKPKFKKPGQRIKHEFNNASKEEKVKLLNSAILSRYMIPGKFKHFFSPKKNKKIPKSEYEKQYSLPELSVAKKSSEILMDHDNSTGLTIGMVQSYLKNKNGKMAQNQSKEIFPDQDNELLDIDNNELSETIDQNQDNQLMFESSGFIKEHANTGNKILENKILEKLQTIQSVESLPSKYLSSYYLNFINANPENYEELEKILEYTIPESAQYFSQLLSIHLGSKRQIKLEFIQVNDENDPLD
ncbi:hypothetical protein BB561_002110 [Smittium simulii]|uniref:Uncharacterized protein n=1 Tax=Smittium simulii TaxID=133385 RepID=A0A2T9YRT0_9FUNG|nr:hypothetical protein BB561_002110 [Smittium simulii]